MKTKNKEQCTIPFVRRCLSGSLIGISLALGIIPLIIASILEKHNLFIEIIDRMDGYWCDTKNNA